MHNANMFLREKLQNSRVVKASSKPTGAAMNSAVWVFVLHGGGFIEDEIYNRGVTV